MISARRINTGWTKPVFHAWRSRCYQGGRQVSERRWVASWETAQKHWNTVVIDLAYWRITLGVRTYPTQHTKEEQ